MANVRIEAQPNKFVVKVRSCFNKHNAICQSGQRRKSDPFVSTAVSAVNTSDLDVASNHIMSRNACKKSFIERKKRRARVDDKMSG